MIRIFVAAGIALIVSLVGTRLLIRSLSRLKLGQPIHEDVPEGHTTKAGTPTMGGLAIVVAAVLSYGISAFYRGIYTVRGILVLAAIVGASAVGLADDWIKVTNERNAGLGKRAKMGGLLAVAIIFAVLLVTQTGQHTELSFTRWDSIGWQMGKVGWVIWAVLLISGMSNAVNLTDGLDGLAAGSAIFAFSAFVIIGVWGFRVSNSPDLNHLYDLTQGLDLAVIAAAMVGACAGFLWWNAAPAQIFMGDTGSMALGGLMAGMAILSRTELLLVVLGGLFVVETLSDIIQVGFFKATRIRTGKGRRVFKMAPIHHHFELGGWQEITVIIRFWIIAGMSVAFGLGLFYADFASSEFSP